MIIGLSTTLPAGVVAEPPSIDSPFAGLISSMGVLLDDNVTTNLGAGTNEDRVLIIRPEDLALLESPMRVSVDQANGNLTEAIAGVRYAWFTAGRYPAGIGIVAGTGLIVPSAW